MRGVLVLNRRQLSKGKRVVIGLLFIAAALFIMTLGTWRRLTPIVHDMALASVKNAVTAAINNSIAEKLSNGELDYTDIVHLEKDSAGQVTALMTDMGRINILKAEITKAIVDDISATRRSELGIPIGNIIGGNMLSGRGPRIPVRIISVASVKTEFKNSFASTGINQTRHRIIIVVNISVGVLLPGERTSTDVSTELTVAETVIVGGVPDSYTYFESDTKWDENVEQFDILH
jgi:sporulation protein YunB